MLRGGRSVILPLFISHQGCPCRCIFCDQQAVTGQVGALPTPREIVERLEAYRATAAGREIELAFYGGSFTLLQAEAAERLLAVASRMKKRREISAIRLSTRPDGIDPPVVSLLKEHAVDLVEIGVQSFDPEVLAASNRGHGPEHAVRAVQLLREGGIDAGIQLMTGLPCDTPERSVASMKRAIQLAPVMLRIHPVVVFAGTALASMMGRGEFVPWDERTTVNTLKEMLLLAMTARIPVARIGIQTDGSGPGTIVGGFAHPATGELVRSAVWGDLLKRLLAGRRSGSILIRVHPSAVSPVSGYRGSNRTVAAALTGARTVRFLPDENADPLSLCIEGDGWRVEGHLIRELSHEC